jgi:predicted lipid-binding transport protein (Tim44 family)
MRAIFGVISLLILVAIVGFVAGRQLKAIRQVPATAPGSVAMAPATAGSANAADPAQQLQQKVRDDLAKALAQGAQNNARSEDAAK